MSTDWYSFFLIYGKKLHDKSIPAKKTLKATTPTPYTISISPSTNDISHPHTPTTIFSILPSERAHTAFLPSFPRFPPLYIKYNHNDITLIFPISPSRR